MITHRVTRHRPGKQRLTLAMRADDGEPSPLPKQSAQVPAAIGLAAGTRGRAGYSVS